ncbi:MULTISPECIES: MBL fold metallo-hydrolase [unclassified Lysobacter]|uniref:MBL fold metallo-hydrolase n=1 Tax=unclassified Lysobacter TaxID=2635362 RepID=UPI001BEA0A6E|nr:MULTISPECIES: MBL fold metallo-hydrolase [unclassified Lysobacter]MBT2745178.1 MBL fold metallo-hydrolase [Lysobacter sp. ISL-42]MBT2751347.1 MBL fold metallo-hydrolase [Lysobacter sp. ISL-50]MBT2777289.1 MBL fold metallo-hydrolase [Lysobacter sp. ISL-54]MBT2781635.1 MBL fold metallo-hydrolase [Lysobacter sp. ISL-52]
MRVHFHGAAGEVTGSLHEVEAAGHRVLLDCGMIQGSPEAERRNLDPFAFDAAALDALVISHAHIDHIGRVPLLVKRGFRGAIHAQEATADLMRIMLLDSASIAESEAERGNRKRQHGEPELIPLYTREDVEATMQRVQPLAYDTRREILPGVEVAFREAGHILGSSVVELYAEDRKLVFSGDLGPKGTPILRDPAPIDRADLVLMESTYGDRLHKDRAETILELGRILESAWSDGGNVLIPAFAVGRSQELLYWFAKYWDEWNVGRWKIFLDSPMAAKVVAVYDRHTDLFDEDAVRVWKQKPNPFHLPNLQLTESAQDSMAINQLERGAIVIAGSGMANAGRILHHFKHNLGKPQTHVVFVGYQAEGTIGRRLVDGAKWVRIHGRDVRALAQRHTIGGLSAHTDQHGLIEWYGQIAGHPPLALVHGEDKAREALAGEIGERFGVKVELARPGMTLQV